MAIYFHRSHVNAHYQGFSTKALTYSLDGDAENLICGFAQVKSEADYSSGAEDEIFQGHKLVTNTEPQGLCATILAQPLVLSI